MMRHSLNPCFAGFSANDFPTYIYLIIEEKSRPKSKWRRKTKNIRGYRKEGEKTVEIFYQVTHTHTHTHTHTQNRGREVRKSLICDQVVLAR